MYFSEDDLEQIRQAYQEVFGKYQRLLQSYVFRRYNNPRAREYATNGFSRRLGTLVRCIDNVFETLPPDRLDLPSPEELSDAEVNIQAFVFNVFGSIDNLAWIWVSERGLSRPDGSPVPSSWVGLGQKNTCVRASFSAEFLGYLRGLDPWFAHLEDFRHALAHRIPLYIPPYMVPETNKAAYQELEERKVEALQRGDVAEHDRLSSEQEALAIFRPCMTHSLEENANLVVFHAQLLADFNTVDELGQKILEELDR